MAINTGDSLTQQEASNEQVDSSVLELIQNGKNRIAFLTAMGLSTLGFSTQATAEEVRIASLDEESIMEVVGTEESITAFTGDQAIAFLNAAQSLRASQVEEFSDRFTALDPDAQARIILAFDVGSGTEGMDDRGIQKLVRGLIMFEDIRENVAFVSENGYVRTDENGDFESTGIMRFAGNLMDDFPLISSVYSAEFMEETLVLYQSARDALISRSEDAQARSEDAQVRSEDAQARSEEMGRQIEEIRELIIQMQSLVVASND